LGLVQTLKPPPSSWQRKLAPLSPEKVKLAEVEFVGSPGLEPIVGAAGAVVSTVKTGTAAKFVASSWMCAFQSPSFALANAGQGRVS